MKKIFLMAGFVLASMTMSAQWYVGGALGLGMSSNGDADGKKTGLSNFTFSIAPEVGYNLTNKIDVGAFLSVGSVTNETFAADKSVNKNTSFNWGISPYVRYSFISFGKFDLLGRLSLNVLGGTKKWYDADGKQITQDGAPDGKDYTTFTIGATITPLLFYNLSKQFSLYTELNFLGVGFSNETESYDGKKTISHTNFNLSANTGTIIENLGAIRIGGVFKF